MIRLAWRQLRPNGIGAGAALIVLALVLGLTGPHLAHLYDISGIPTCTRYGDCDQLEATFLLHDRHLSSWLDFLVLAVPAILGVFFGAPLIAHELESGTFRLAWTQSVSAARWLAVKLVIVVLAAMVTAGIVSLAVTWWSSPIDRAVMSPFAMFDRRDIVPVAYAAFAVALGAFVGMLVRRTLPAMAVTLISFIGVRVVIYEWVRPHLTSPLRLTTALRLPLANGPGSLTSGAIDPTSWVTSDQTLDATGRVIGENGGIGPNGNLDFGGVNGRLGIKGVGSCPGIRPARTPEARWETRPANPNANVALQKCVTELHLRELLTFQPAGRYWSFQWYESGIFLCLALVLGGLCLWWIRHRLN